MTARVVLVTGVSRYVGGRLAAQLSADPSVERVIGVDVFLSEPRTPAEDQHMQDVLTQAGVVILASQAD